MLVAGGDVEIGGRYADRDKLGYRWVLAHDGRWTLLDMETKLASGTIDAFSAGTWHRLRLEMNGHTLRGLIDGKLVTETDRAARRGGMAFLASTYHRNSFDNLRVEPVGR